MNLEKIPAFNKKGTVNVIIETLKGGRHKYAYDPKLEIMRLKKVLPAGSVFPFDFGFVPQTEGPDGDPIDVLVLMEDCTFTGCLLECRIIGVIEAEQFEDSHKFRNDRFIGVAAESAHFEDLTSLKQMQPPLVEQIEEFFISYNRMAGKRFKPLRALGPHKAMKLLRSKLLAKGK